MSISQSVLSAVFSDETPAYRFPAEPNPGDTVTIRIRVARDCASRVMIHYGATMMGPVMYKTESDTYFDYYDYNWFHCNARKSVLYSTKTRKK